MRSIYEAIDWEGRPAFRKTRPDAPPDFFLAEANGLEWLAEARAVSIPHVLAVDEQSITLSRIASGTPGVPGAEAFARSLGELHQRGAEGFGAPWPGFIGDLAADNQGAADWYSFYRERRVLPYLRQARDRQVVSAQDAQLIEAVLHRLEELGGEPEGPHRLHGDLWSGNLLWDTDGTAWLIDPAAHGGHRETDLAMLALFGAPHLDRILAAYDEAWALAPGWQDRVALHQLHPLLVHAVLFGGDYGRRAADGVARYR
jgi:fructosamine-3-kinase